MNIEKGSKVYFSASIKGENPDPTLGAKVINYLKESGYQVLSEHVGGVTQEERDNTLLEKTGIDRRKLEEPEASQFIRKIDTQWVDESDFMVVIISGASLGVGMEIERALLKPERGMKRTPILCFTRENYLPVLSSMVRGVTEDVFTLFSYLDYDDIRIKLESKLKSD